MTEETRWPKPILCSELPPQPGRVVLMDNGERYCVGYHVGNGEYFTEQDGMRFFAQYWYPLPTR